MEPNTPATTARLEAELERVTKLVHAELVRSGELSEPMPAGWRPTDAITQLQDRAQLLEPMTSAILEAGIMVQKTLESLSGPREVQLHALRDLASAIRRLDSSTDDTVCAYSATVASVGSRIGFNDEPRVDSARPPELDANIDMTLLRKIAAVAEAKTEQLAHRRPTAIRAEHYCAKGSGPFAHFLWELAQPLAPAEALGEYAEWFGRWLPVTKESLSAPRLTLAQIAQLADETYHHSKRTNEDLEDAVDRVRKRILRFHAGCIGTGSP